MTDTVEEKCPTCASLTKSERRILWKENCQPCRDPWHDAGRSSTLAQDSSGSIREITTLEKARMPAVETQAGQKGGVSNPVLTIPEAPSAIYHEPESVKDGYSPAHVESSTVPAAPAQPVSELTKRIREKQAMTATTTEAFVVRCPSLDEAAVSPVVETAQPIEDALRMELWLQHGHFASLYGDDGEMQCGHRDCRLWDYKRSPVLELVEQVRNIRVTRNRGA